MKKPHAHSRIMIVVLLFCAATAFAGTKSGEGFSTSDVHYEEVQMEFVGICICPRPPPVFYEEGEVWRYWEPFLVIDTVSDAYYSPYNGDYTEDSSLTDLDGKNNSADGANSTNESTFAQAHGYLLQLMYGPCSRHDYGFWKTESDSMWQSDELSAVITPEASMYANVAMQMDCMLDATATNLGAPLDVMPWCIGSSGSSYPMTGHVDNDNIVQANNTVASRLIYKLNRLFMICDPAMSLCGCMYTPVWVKSHYKMHVVRPGDRSPAWPMGVSSKFYEANLTPAYPPYRGEKGSSDEFMWVVYRQQICCTCCDS